MRPAANTVYVHYCTLDVAVHRTLLYFDCTLLYTAHLCTPCIDYISRFYVHPFLPWAVYSCILPIAAYCKFLYSARWCTLHSDIQCTLLSIAHCHKGHDVRCKGAHSAVFKHCKVIQCTKPYTEHCYTMHMNTGLHCMQDCINWLCCTLHRAAKRLLQSTHGAYTAQGYKTLKKLLPGLYIE